MTEPETDPETDPGGRPPQEIDADEHAATLPEIQTRRLRERLYIVELERLLGDPLDFPPNEEYDFDSIRVRLDCAIEAVEKRSTALAEEAYSRQGVLRFGVALSCLVGIVALFAALGLTAPEWRLLAYVVAAVELVLVFYFTRLARVHAVDCLELRRLAERYRPDLEACRTAADLRALARRIGEEMGSIWAAPAS